MSFDEIDLNLAKQRQKEDEKSDPKNSRLLIQASDWRELDALKLFQESGFIPNYK